MKLSDLVDALGLNSFVKQEKAIRNLIEGKRTKSYKRNPKPCQEISLSEIDEIDKILTSLGINPEYPCSSQVPDPSPEIDEIGAIIGGDYAYDIISDELFNDECIIVDDVVYNMKRRTNDLYSYVFPNDYAQTQLFMHLTKLNEAIIVAYKENFYKRAAIPRDDSFIDKMLEGATLLKDNTPSILDKTLKITDLLPLLPKLTTPKIKYGEECYLNNITYPDDTEQYFLGEQHRKGDDVIALSDGITIEGKIKTIGKNVFQIIAGDRVIKPDVFRNMSHINRLRECKSQSPFGDILRSIANPTQIMYLDIETDGKKNIVQISYMTIDCEKNKTMKTIYVKHDPIRQDYYKKIPKGVIEEKGMDISAALDIFLADLHKSGCVIGHNIKTFDINQIKINCRRYGKPIMVPLIIDTMKFTRYMIDSKDKRGRTKPPTLSEVVMYLDLDLNHDLCHDARYDVLLLYRCIERMESEIMFDYGILMPKQD